MAKKIEKVKSTPKKNQQTLFDLEKAPDEKKSDDEGRLAKKLYRANKRKVMKEEKTNTKYIIIVRENKVWYKMFGNSALIFKRYVTPRIQAELNPDFKAPNLMDDSDFDASEYKGPQGRVPRVLNFPNITPAIEAMEKIGYKPVVVEENGKVNKNIIKYQMDREFTDKAILKMQKVEDYYWHEINRTIVPDESYPDLSMKMTTVARQVFYKVKKFPKDAKEIIGRDTMAAQEEMMEKLIMAERGKLSWDEFFERVSELVARVYASMVYFSEIRLVDRKELLELAVDIVELEKSIEKARKAHGKRVQ